MTILRMLVKYIVMRILANFRSIGAIVHVLYYDRSIKFSLLSDKFRFLFEPIDDDFVESWERRSIVMLLLGCLFTT
jgi:hypothetical protein